MEGSGYGDDDIFYFMNLTQGFSSCRAMAVGKGTRRNGMRVKDCAVTDGETRKRSSEAAKEVLGHEEGSKTKTKEDSTNNLTP